MPISFIESSFLLENAVDAVLVECDPKTVMSTLAFSNTVTHYLEIVDVVLRLWGLTNFIKRFCTFGKSFVFQYIVQDDLQHRFPDMGILKGPLVPDDILDVIVLIILTNCNTQMDCKKIRNAFQVRLP